MGFISAKDEREYLQSVTPVESPAAAVSPTFGETFAASLGQVVDEEWSISGALNREGWERRKQIINQKIEERGWSRERFAGEAGFDYDLAAKQLNDPEVPTHDQLNAERAKILELRRNYSEDVIERGNGMAQFLGAGVGYILDPVNIATIPIASATVTSKSLGALGRALYTARNEAAISAAVELGIQGFVYQHKQDINSPYTIEDALTNIGMAATGAAVLSGTTTSLSEYLGKAIKSADDLPASDELLEAIDNLERAQMSIKNAPNKTLDGEIEFLRELEAQRVVTGAPSKNHAQYEAPQTFNPVNQTKGLREREVLEELGLAEEFDFDIQKFNEIDAPNAIVDGEVVDAKAVMADLDNQLEGLDSVLVCARG